LGLAVVIALNRVLLGDRSGRVPDFSFSSFVITGSPSTILIEQTDVEKLHLVTGVILYLALLIDLHVALVLGPPCHREDFLFPWVLGPVFSLIRHFKAVPNQLAGEEFDV
jgi:hypothetical protein